MKKNVVQPMVQLAGLIVALVGLVNLTGYACNIPALTTWGGDTAMAIPTAINFLATGAGLILVGECKCGR